MFIWQLPWTTQYINCRTVFPCADKLERCTRRVVFDRCPAGPCFDAATWALPVALDSWSWPGNLSPQKSDFLVSASFLWYRWCSSVSISFMGREWLRRMLKVRWQTGVGPLLGQQFWRLTLEHFFGPLLLLAIAVQCFARQQTGKDAAEPYVIADEIHWVFKIKGLKGYHFSALPHTYHIIQYAIDESKLWNPSTLNWNCEIINSTSVYSCKN